MSASLPYGSHTVDPVDSEGKRNQQDRIITILCAKSS